MKKESICILISIVGLFISYLIWDIIKIPYTEQSIYGIYSLNNHHSLNDIFRVLTFITVPVFFYIFAKSFFLKKNIFLDFFFKITQKNEEDYLVKKKDFLFFILFISVIIFITFEFLTVEFPLYQMDIYHEGQRLSSAFKFQKNSTLWSENFVTVGIIYETILSKLAWDLFGSISLGSLRAFDIIIIYLFKLILCFFSLIIANNSKLFGAIKYIYFACLTLLFLSLIDYSFPTADLINARDIVVFITLICIIYLSSNRGNSYLLITILGFLSIFSLFWSLDRGLVCNLLIIISLIYFLAIKDLKKTISILLSLLIFWIITFLLFNDEFIYFIKNSLIVISEMSYIHGVIFPKPFSDDPDSSRAAKNLLVLIFTVLIMVNLYIKNNKFPHSLKFILLLVLATSFLSLIYIFGRSDGPHIKNIFGFSIIFIGIFLFFYVLKIIDDRFKNNLNRRNIEYFSIIIILFSFYLNLNFNLKNISSFNERLSTYVKYDDSKFVQEDYINLVSNSKNFLSKADCVQLYTNDVGILYLLRKKNCTKYYFVWSVGSSDTQLDMIKEMNNTNFIISNGKTDNWDVPLNKKLYLIDEYINKNFEEVTDISGFKILERNN